MKVKDEMQFDRLVLDQLELDPPESARIEQADPFSHPVYLILWGIILQTIQIGFFKFFIVPLVPFIGAALVYCGARILRNAGPWFRAMFFLSGAKIGFMCLGVLLYAFPGNEALLERNLPPAILAAGIVEACLQAGILLTLAMGFRSLFQARGLHGRSRLLLVTVVFLGISGVALVWPEGWIRTLGVVGGLGSFVALVKVLMKMEDGLSDVGYDFRAAPIRFRTLTVVAAYVALVCASLTLASAVTNHPQIQGSTWEGVSNPAVLEARVTLAEAGVPGQILEDLSGESTLLLARATDIQARSEDISLRSNPSFSLSWDGMDWGSESGGVMDTTTVAFRMPDGQTYVLYAFDLQDLRARWGDIAAVYGHENQPMELIEGRLLYVKGGQDWEASFPELTEGTYRTSVIGGQLGYEVPAILGRVSYPFGSREQRGYILYRTDAGDASWLDVETGYLHFGTPLRLPPLPINLELSAGRGVEGYAQFSFEATP